jgi:hypothetical protein
VSIRGDLHPEDEKYLKALSNRLEESSKESIIYIQRSAKKDDEEEIDPLKPRVTIHHKEEKESVVHIRQEEPEGRKEGLFEDENLYEVEKVEVKGPEFLEVKPKEILKEEKLESETSDKKKYTEDMKHQELPEWEPVDIKKTEFKEVKGYRHGDYTLYKKEIEASSGKKRIVHFFSKAEPDEGVPVKSPVGFEVKINKKTGVPYLRKKSKKK